MKRMSELMKRISRFWRECRGVASVEFALIVPVMVMLWVGIIEVANLHLAGRKATVAAQAAADLVAQRLTVGATSIADIAAAMNAIFVPFPSAPMSYEIVSVQTDAGGVVSVGWRVTRGSLDGNTTVPPAALPLVSTNDSVIVVTVIYLYHPTLDLIFGDLNIEEQAFARPRRTLIIPWV